MLTFEPRLPIAAITDEFSPSLPQALTVMKEIGMTAAELRTVDGKNLVDLSQDEVAQVRHQLDSAGLPVISIASPLLKCVLPDSPALDGRFQQDAFASRHTFADQPRLTDRALELAAFFKAPIVRVFSYWRTVQPEETYAKVAEALYRLADRAASIGVTIGLENEHACNVATGAEAARILQAVDHANLKLVWDPANALVAGEQPYPTGYALLPKHRIVHVHAKDCHMNGHLPVWGPLGTRHVLWKDQLAALLADGYQGFVSLETHWPGPDGNKLEASRICGWNLRGLAAG
ncbi:MAG TPA: sugar phosphate isomerase/epimerase family protein [Bryobacteraceae bacterium]|jgi:sugar phosphate isomerase/epimerase|nr:sugar phosphate isomerase/epimerase family protein [Bryobacteraceae bacterium]